MNIFQEQKQKPMSLEISEENQTTVCSPILTPLSIISTSSGNVAQSLGLDEDPPPDFYQTISWVSPSSTQSDGVYLTGVSLTKREPNCQISTSTLRPVNDQEFSKPSVKKEENSDLYRLRLSELKNLSQQFSQLAAATGVTTAQMVQMLTKLNTCLL